MQYKVRLKNGALALSVALFLFAYPVTALPAIHRLFRTGGLAEIKHSSYRAADYFGAVTEEGAYRWKTGAFPIHVFVEDGMNVPGYRKEFRTILTSSFNEWVRASGKRLSWQEVSDKAAADVVCSWTGTTAEAASGTELGRTRNYTHFDPSINCGTIYKTTMTLSTRLPERDLTGDELVKAYLHEVGHVFGLAGHSPFRSDIMFAAVSPLQAPHLSIRDVNTINRLYGFSMAPKHARRLDSHSNTG